MRDKLAAAGAEPGGGTPEDYAAVIRADTVMWTSRHPRSRNQGRVMPVRHEIDEGRVPVKIYTGEIEPAARAQLVNVSKLPIVHHHVARCPTCTSASAPPWAR
jgi:hypothetical protein